MNVEAGGTDPAGAYSAVGDALGPSEPEPNPLIEIRDVSLSYGDKLVLDRVSLNVARSEVLVIIGASGCGKTTLLNVVAGLAHYGDGSVTVDGVAINHPGPDRVMVFQDDAVFPWLTVEKNIHYGLRRRRVKSKEARSRVEKVIELVGLEGSEELYPRQLSGGMRKRVDLARALAVEPDILLMDEPYAALDAMTKERLQLEFLNIQREKKMTVLFVTHDLEEGLFLGDRVAAMGLNPGRIVSMLDVPFTGARDLDLKRSTEFQKLRGELARQLELGHVLQEGAE